MTSNNALRLANVADNFASRRVETDVRHRLFEEQAVLGHLDGLGFRADHLDVVFVENSGFGKFDRNVQRRLTADGRQQRIGPFALDDGRDKIRRQRLDIRAVGQLGIRHDRRRIRIDQNDLVAFLAQAPCRLAFRNSRIRKPAR